MWRDELQAFMIAANGRTLADVFATLRYDGHPGLWHTLLWVISRVSADPFWMQVAHAAIGAATWILIYRASPFDRREKILLVLGYFFFWEYFVLSRNYALMALLGLAVVALRARRPERGVLPWLLLGLLANTVIYGTIWSIAMAVFLAASQRVSARRSLAIGGVVYAALLALAVFTMRQPADQGLRHRFSVVPRQLAPAFGVPVDALAPLPVCWTRDVWAMVRTPEHAPFPRFWNPVPVRGLTERLALDEHPERVLIVLLAGLAACWLVIRDRRAFAELALGYTGIVLFTWLWHFPGYARHHGVVWLMLIAAVWTVRARDPRAARSGLWSVLLVVHALTGLTTLTAELRPFSEGRATAAWLNAHHLADGPLLGSEDLRVSTVAGYLRRPIYYLEREESGTFIKYDTRRQPTLSRDELGRRIGRALAAAGGRDAILLLTEELSPETAVAAPSVTFTALARFTGAVIPGERYFVYRVGASADPHAEGGAADAPAEQPREPDVDAGVPVLLRHEVDDVVDDRRRGDGLGAPRERLVADAQGHRRIRGHVPHPLALAVRGDEVHRLALHHEPDRHVVRLAARPSVMGES